MADRWACFLAALLFSCSQPIGPSTVRGEVPAGSGLDGVTTAYAVDTTGKEYAAPLVDGRFELEVPTPATYSFFVASSAERIQLLLPRLNRFDASIILAAEEATVSLGPVIALPLDATFRFVPEWPPGTPTGCGVAAGNDVCVIEQAYQGCDTTPQPMPANACTIDRIKAVGSPRNLPGALDGVRYAIALKVPPCAVSDCAPLQNPP